MENYKQASEMGQDLILTYLRNRMKEKKSNAKQTRRNIASKRYHVD